MCLACVFVSVHHACAWGWMGQKRASYPLGLELQTFTGCYVGAGNRIQVFWRSSRCSQGLSHLSSYTLKTVLEREPFGKLKSEMTQ